MMRDIHHWHDISTASLFKPCPYGTYRHYIQNHRPQFKLDIVIPDRCDIGTFTALHDSSWIKV